MRHSILTAALFLCAMQPTLAQTDCVSADGVSIGRDGSRLTVGMTIDLSDLEVGRNRAVLITPRIVNGTDSVELPSIGVYGRKRYYYYVRNSEGMLSGKDETTYRASSVPQSVEYNHEVPYSAWMDGSQLTLHREEYGCCNTVLDECDVTVGSYSVFVPRLRYALPQVDRMKSRSLQGSALIDFPVNKTAIYSDYHNNAEELGKIRATIDSVKNDQDMTITSVWLKGYASPEGSYRHNGTLAKGRTAAVKSYIQELYRFDANVITTDYEPEDWAGLRAYVERSSIDHRSEILEIIDDSGLEPDAREAKIKKTYPSEYSYLLENCYPWLRHTDYRVGYTIRSYTDVNEIREVMRSNPQKLSLEEFRLLAQECEPGSGEFSDVYETAVRMFPDDEVANLNAANVEMARGDLTAASRHLEKAGTSGEADYARGVCAYMSEDYPTAVNCLQRAQDAGIEEAAEALRHAEMLSGR